MRFNILKRLGVSMSC